MPSLIRRFAVLLSFCLVASNTLYAQTANPPQTGFHYIAEGQPVALSPDASHLALHAHDGQLGLLQQSLQAAAGVADVEVHPHHNRILVELAAPLAGEPIPAALAWAQAQGFPASVLRSAVPAFVTENGDMLWLTHDVVLQPKAGVVSGSLQPLLDRYGAQFSRNRFGTLVAEVDNPVQGLALGNALENSGLVRFAHTDFYARIERHDDPLFGDQFQLNNTGQVIDGFTGAFDIDCNAPEAWTVTLGSASVIVAVIDDGVEAHEDLVNGSGASRVLTGFTPATGGNGSPESGAAHGQACTGIIAASHNDLGVQGIAPNVQILPVNIFAGGETSQDLADAFTFAKNNGADVLSNSWGYTSCFTSFSNLTNAINDVAANGRSGLGSVVAFSSGNGYNTCVYYPSKLNSVLSVGSVTNQGNHSDYSNEGPNLDIVAPSNSAPGQPGAGVRTIDRMGGAGYSSGNYTTGFGGTSAACPVVAGVAALVVSANPGASGPSIQNTLITTATDMGSTGFDNTYGWGRVNAAAALAIGPAPTVSVNGTVEDAAGNPISGAAVVYLGPSGPFNATTDAAGQYSLSGLIDGQFYDVFAGKWGFETTYNAAVALDGSSLTTVLPEGYRDNFELDLGWSTSGTASTGLWTRGEPIGTDFSGQLCNPDADALDFGSLAFMTGNGGGSAGTDDVDGGTAILTSPAMDLSGYSDAWIRWSQWFFNDGGSGTPDDVLNIRLDNGSSSAIVASIGGSGIVSGGWTRELIRVSDFLSPSANMTLSVETADGSTGHLVEAAFDRFTVIDSGAVPDCSNAPAGLSASIGATGVTMSWNSLAGEGALSYLVSGRRAGGSAFRTLAPIAEPTTTAFVGQNKLRAGWTYEWKVQAQCAGGLSSPESALGSFTWPGLREAADQLEPLSLQPNPATSRVLLDWTATEGMARVLVLDLSGRVVLSDAFNASAGPMRIDLAIGPLADGFYLVELEQDGQRQTQRLTVQR